MSKLLILFEAVKEDGLTKDQLEKYRDELASLYSQMHLEMGEILKRKALFMGSALDEPMTKLKIKWENTIDGTREIELKSYIRATSPILSSLKSRLYQIY